MQALCSAIAASPLHTTLRTAAISRVVPLSISAIAARQTRLFSSAHDEESYEEFTDRYVEFFDACEESQELQRGLNNCFSYDCVPAATVCEAALKCSRRLNEFPVAVRVLDALERKTETKEQYHQYLEALRPLMDELGVATRDELGYKYNTDGHVYNVSNKH